jgi:hypothetical protein
MRIKFVVGELKELNHYNKTARPKNGFQSFIFSIQCRVDEDTGEVDLADDDLAKITLYGHRGYKKRPQKIFQRPMGARFDWSY